MRGLRAQGCLFVVLNLGVALAFAPALESDAAQAPDHVLVKFKSEVGTQIRHLSIPESLTALRNSLKLPAGAELSEPALNQWLRAQRHRGQLAGEDRLNLERFLYLRLPPGLSVADGVRSVSAHPWVDYAEPDGVGTGGLIPNDPEFFRQWHHQNLGNLSASIHTPPAWDITQGSTDVILAVLDSGLVTSTEFSGRLVPGYNFAYGNSDTTDDHGHGTAVAGTAVAAGNNSTLVAGVDWRCRLMPVKVLDSGNSGLYSWWAQGVDFAVSNGARVINLSSGGSSSSTTLTRAITNAIASGVIFVTITHNDSSNVIRFPGNVTNCITVGATDEQDYRAGFSNYGPQIDLCAPGVNINTVGRSGTLQIWNGTSFSAPQVAGVCGLLISLRPNLSPDEARLLLCAGADDGVGDATDTPGFDKYYGWGRLNAYNSLVLAQTRVDQIHWSNNAVRLSWRSPPNAANKQPFQVQFRNTLTGAWTTATASGRFEYVGDRTYWTDTNAAGSARFYRVQLRALP